MLEMSIKKAKPDADVIAFDDQDELIEDAEKMAATLPSLISI